MKAQPVLPDSKEMAKQTSSVHARILSKQKAIAELSKIASIESTRKINWEEESPSWNDH